MFFVNNNVWIKLQFSNWNLNTIEKKYILQFLELILIKYSKIEKPAQIENWKYFNTNGSKLHVGYVNHDIAFHLTSKLKKADPFTNNFNLINCRAEVTRFIEAAEEIKNKTTFLTDLYPSSYVNIINEGVPYSTTLLMTDATNHHIFFMAFFMVSKILGNIIMDPGNMGMHTHYLFREIEMISGGDVILKENLSNIIYSLIEQIKEETERDPEKCLIKATEILYSMGLESYEWDGKKSKLIWKYESVKYLNLKKEIVN